MQRIEFGGQPLWGFALLCIQRLPNCDNGTRRAREGQLNLCAAHPLMDGEVKERVEND